MQQSRKNENYKEKLREMNDRMKRFKNGQWELQMEKNKGNKKIIVKNFPELTKDKNSQINES